MTFFCDAKKIWIFFCQCAAHVLAVHTHSRRHFYSTPSFKHTLSLTHYTIFYIFFARNIKHTHIIYFYKFTYYLFLSLYAFLWRIIQPRFGPGVTEQREPHASHSRSPSSGTSPRHIRLLSTQQPLAGCPHLQHQRR